MSRRCASRSMTHPNGKKDYEPLTDEESERLVRAVNDVLQDGHAFDSFRRVLLGGGPTSNPTTAQYQHS